MMEFFIRVKDGLPFEHPIYGDNFCQAFPHIDTNNLPPEFAKFERVEIPIVGVYEVYEGATYIKEGDVYKDVHHVRAMTSDEKTARQEKTKQQWVEQEGFASWAFDEVTCTFVPPVPFPTDEKTYYWNEELISWIEVI